MATDHRPLWVLRGLLALATLILAGGPATAAPLTRATLPLFSLGCAELPGVSGSATVR